MLGSVQLIKNEFFNNKNLWDLPFLPNKILTKSKSINNQVEVIKRNKTSKATS